MNNENQEQPNTSSSRSYEREPCKIQEYFQRNLYEAGFELDRYNEAQLNKAINFHRRILLVRTSSLDLK